MMATAIFRLALVGCRTRTRLKAPSLIKHIHEKWLSVQGTNDRWMRAQLNDLINSAELPVTFRHTYTYSSVVKSYYSQDFSWRAQNLSNLNEAILLINCPELMCKTLLPITPPFHHSDRLNERSGHSFVIKLSPDWVTIIVRYMNSLTIAQSAWSHSIMKRLSSDISIIFHTPQAVGPRLSFCSECLWETTTKCYFDCLVSREQNNMH